MQHIESFIERVLWSSRLMVLVAVVASIVVALVMLAMATLDVVSHRCQAACSGFRQ